MNRPSTPVWQWALILIVLAGAISSGGYAVYLILRDPSLLNGSRNNSPAASAFPAPQNLNSAAKTTPLLPPPSATPTTSPTPTSTATPTPTATFTSTPTATATDTETPLPTLTERVEPTSPPVSSDTTVLVNGFIGHPQSFPLSCEARSAVDLAAFFGVSVSEADFQANLPTSDDPNVGFVGSPWGPGGQIPPYSYGVYASPVAALLRNYGLPANDRYGMTYEELQQEISAGRPVMVWVIAGFLNGYVIEYTAASTGQTSRVAYGEHTVVVIGYTAGYVIANDGGWIYYIGTNQFLRTWAVLGNMAITVGSE